ncbi:hypothetical protein BJ912DRAFT_1052189 [Pholiota molesta]|nr:hypothetical protein BJ912DRAFT_1052189 [Pholiota molesta]
MQSNRAPSPFRPPSPYGSSSDPQYRPHSLPTGPAQVGPGAITYKTSTGPDGRIIYEPYRAVAASYHTPSGVVSGIQWMKADPSSVVPPGAQPYASAVPAGWNPNGQVPSTHDWQRSDEKRRKHEEKAEAKRYREVETNSRKDPDYDLRMARERDAQSTTNRDRRKSFNTGAQNGPDIAFPSTSGSGGYPVHPSQMNGYGTSPYSDYAGLHAAPGVPIYPSGMDGRSHSRNPSANGSAYGDLANQFNDLDIDRQKDYERDRKSSNPKRTGKYSTNDDTYERARTISGNYVDRNAYPSAAGAYQSAPGPFSNHQIPSHPGPYPTNSYIAPSPNMHAGEIPYGAGASGYPMSNNSASAYTGHLQRAQQHLLGLLNIIPAATYWKDSPFQTSAPNRDRGHPLGRPLPILVPKYGTSSTSYGKSPHIAVTAIPGEPQQLPAPEAFSRPINGSNSFLPFEMTKIQDMEDIYDAKMPKMPSVLSSHDIYQEDWKRCMQDLGRSWTGQLPVPSFGKEGQPRRSTLAADLVDLWNASFFFNRGVELILYKGRERRTGPQAGIIDHSLPQYYDDDYSSSSLTSTSDSESEYNHASGPYGRPGNSQTVELQEARRRRHEEKKERRRRRKEKKARRRAKSRDKTYSVYIVCLPRGAAVPVPYAVGAQPVTGGYGVMSNAAGGYAPAGGYVPPTTYTPGYGQPVGIPKTRSHGYGGDY